MVRASFNNRQAHFYSALKEEVDGYFKTKNIKPTGNWLLYLKTALFLLATLSLYVVLVFYTPVWYVALPLCGLLGAVSAFIGFNVMHDGCHGAYSTKKWVNETMGYSLNLLGSSSFFWKAKHNLVHHTFTNIDGMDEDIEPIPLLRFAPSQPLNFFHKYQHLYGVFLYGFVYLFWVFFADFKKYFSRKVMETPINGFSTREHIVFWLSKLIYVFLFMVVPIYNVGFVSFLVGFITMQLVIGMMLAVVFQLAHVVEKTEFEDATKADLKIEHEWAIHQVRTTADFATGSPVVSFFLGGLNYQVEHHLFPKISHVHYPDIHPIVVKVCERFDVEINKYPTMVGAVCSHFRMLKLLGNGAIAGNAAKQS